MTPIVYGEVSQQLKSIEMDFNRKYNEINERIKNIDNKIDEILEMKS